MVSIGDQTIWVEQGLEHLRYEYDLSPSDLVLDIGSYRREFAEEIIRRYNCNVHCFDALDNHAAWIFDGEIEMGGSFYYTSIYEKLNSKYRCVDIARFLKQETALVKINIEGGEYILLDYIIKNGLISNIKNLQIQFHLIDEMDCKKMYSDLQDRLIQTHELTWGYPFVWENWKRIKNHPWDGGLLETSKTATE